MQEYGANLHIVMEGSESDGRYSTFVGVNANPLRKQVEICSDMLMTYG